MSEVLEQSLVEQKGRIVTAEDLKIFDDAMNGFTGGEYVPVYVTEYNTIGANFLNYYSLGYSLENPDVCTGLYCVSFVKYIIPGANYKFVGLKQITQMNISGVVVDQLIEDDYTVFENQYGRIIGVNYKPLLKVYLGNTSQPLFWFAEMNMLVKNPVLNHMLLLNKDYTDININFGGWTKPHMANPFEVVLAEYVYNEHKEYKIDSRSIKVHDVSTQIVNGTNYNYTVEQFVGLISEGMYTLSFHLDFDGTINDYKFEKK